MIFSFEYRLIYSLYKRTIGISHFKLNLLLGQLNISTMCSRRQHTEAGVITKIWWKYREWPRNLGNIAACGRLKIDTAGYPLLLFYPFQSRDKLISAVKQEQVWRQFGWLRACYHPDSTEFSSALTYTHGLRNLIHSLWLWWIQEAKS